LICRHVQPAGIELAIDLAPNRSDTTVADGHRMPFRRAWHSTILIEDMFRRAIAPTLPHAGVESAKLNFAVGPFASMLDRVRDVIQEAIGSPNLRSLVT
jgi:hypothetical protein